MVREVTLAAVNGIETKTIEHRIELDACVDISRIRRILSSRDWDSECSRRFAALPRREADLFVCFFRYRARLRRTLGEGLSGDLLDGSCCGRKLKSMLDRPNVGMYARALLSFPSTKMLSSDC